jgi:Secretion system C-terminal sorting domain
MKKHYIIILSSFVSLASFTNAQPILTDVNTNFQIGEEYPINAVEYVAEGSSGANVTWDFSDLTILQTNVFTAYDPSESSFASNFPDATILLKTPDQDLDDFYITNASSWERNGYVAFSTVIIPFSDPEKILSFPFTYNSTFTDFFEGTFDLSGFNTIRSGNVTVLADAYGTITLPTGTYSDVLRVKIVEDYTDEIVDLSYVLIYENVQYIWYLPGQHYPIFSTSIFNSDGSTTQSSGYFEPNSSDLKENLSKNDFKVFPNPASTDANISYALDNNSDVKITLVNSLGQVIEESIFVNQNVGKQSHIINTAKLSQGLYLVNLKIEGKIITKELVVE